MAADKRPVTFDLYVANMPLAITSEVLMQSFQRFGPICSVQICDGSKNNAKMGFVRFFNQQSVERALTTTIHINMNKIVCRIPNRSSGRPAQNGGIAGGGFTTSGRSSDDGLDAVAQLPSNLNEHRNEGPDQNGKFLRILVTHIESPTIFWAQRAEEASVIEKVQASLSKYCSDMPFKRTRPDLRKTYGTQFSMDQQWYRCQIFRYISENQSEVIYMDYGNREIVNNNRIVDLPDYLVQLQGLASKYCLHGIKAADDPKLIDLGVEKLSVFTDNSLLCAFAHEPSSGEVISVDLKTADGVDIAEEMLKSKTCVRKEDRTFLKTMRKQPSPLPSGGSLADKTQVPRLMEIKLNNDSGDAKNAKQSDSLAARENEKFEKERLSLEGVIAALQKESEATKQELKAIQEKRVVENNEFIEKFRTLVEQKQTVERKLMWMSENTLAKTVGRVFTDIQSLTLLRNQCDSIASAPDSLEEAITVATDSSFETSLNAEHLLLKIDTIRTRFQSLQTDLLKTSEDAERPDVSKLDQLITERDVAKRELHSSLREFVVKFEDIDALASVITKMEKILSTINSKYDSYLASPMPNALVAGDCFKEYINWKKIKREDVEISRQQTQKKQCLVLEGLKTLQDELSRRIGTVDLTEPVIPDLDQLFKDFETAVDSEIRLMNQKESQSDIETIAKTLVSAGKTLNGNIEAVQKLVEQRAQFAEESEQMSTWLTGAPDVSLLQTTMKNIRRLKSKLRHCLVDLQDMEEDDANGVELKEIKEGLANIRELLQEQLALEDKQLEQLAQLAVMHFPELIVKHPEFSFQKVIDYNGILKSDYTLDLFHLSPLPDGDKRELQQSSCCGKPILLKKFLIGANNRGEFLRRMKEYSEVPSSFLPKIMAVFFEMNEWQAVVVRPLFDISLARLVEREPGGDLRQISKARIISCVLQGLNALHGADLVHGAVHPNNVLIDLSRGRAVLSEYDFSKSPLQRAENPYITTSGLKFLAPELESGSLASSNPLAASADMYNFGLLIIWLHSPFSTKISADNVNDLCHDALDLDTATLVTLLLHAEPESRPTVDKILAVGFFPPIDEGHDEPSLSNNTDTTDPCPEDENATEKMATDGREETPVKSSAEEVRSLEANVDKVRESEDSCENKETKPELKASGGGQEKSGDASPESSSHARVTD